MRNLVGAIAFAFGFSFAQHAAALTIDATLTGWEATPHTVAGVGTGGGRGQFSLVGSDAPITGALASVLDAQFYAVCMEPDQLVNIGATYRFNVVDLAFAPTSPASTQGMGAAREAAIETVLGRFGVTTVDDMSLTAVGRATALVYEAGYESAVNALDLTAGTAVVTGPQAGSVQVALGGGPVLTDVDAFALINVAQIGGFGVRTVYEAQDFMITTVNVPEPGTIAMLGLGLLGLGYVRSKKIA